jgi:hypothetical protein
MTRQVRRGAAVGGGLLLLVVVGVVVSVARTEILRASFQRQVLVEARYAGAELLGARVETGKLVKPGSSAIAGGRNGGAHCDFAAQTVYGTGDEYEPVEAHYVARTVSVGGKEPVAFDVQPVADRALATAPLRRGDPALATREQLLALGVDLLRAGSFRTVFVVQVISWGHHPWLDWRCW